jgi:hypothetical protein
MLEQLPSVLSATNVVGLVILFWILRSIQRWILEERLIHDLGGRAAKRTSKLPFSLDLIYQGAKHSAQHRDLDNWHSNFEYGHPNNPYTVETYIGGDRIIFTAGPENIKAILATQFGDYGKGPDFNQDWYDFLGDSKLSDISSFFLNAAKMPFG